jgi:transposase
MILLLAEQGFKVP